MRMMSTAGIPINSSLDENSGSTSWLKHVCDVGGEFICRLDLTIVNAGSNPSSGMHVHPVNG